MTLTAGSVVALNCAECEADLRGAAKLLRGDVYLCPTCFLRLERPDARRPQTEPAGENCG